MGSFLVVICLHCVFRFLFSLFLGGGADSKAVKRDAQHRSRKGADPYFGCLLVTK